ncbi:MAG: hypothetical protein ACRCVA_30065, partial [Phreatobacter sp.]
MVDIARAASRSPGHALPRPDRRHLREIVLASSVTPWVLPLAILIAWQLGSHAGVIPANVLPAPIDVLDAAIRLTLSGELAANIAVSFRRAASGFLVGGALAFALGLLNGLSALSERLTDTTV